MLFGELDPSYKVSMILARFSMGVWEALFSCWVLGWIGCHARKQANESAHWNNNLGIAAAMGSGVGGLMASFMTPDFGPCFRLQAELLLGVFILVAFLPRRILQLKKDNMP